ncbi:DUF523 and DUF1722 domain-containing protein [Ammoniphilus sp. YIM 78166]|uniref:YbgA family protein n=1 Tax=Ammoniphilus sp. YIM 78166 TaxID=1644106 RepID=UPI0010705356|nr:DUF523 and DUF1722 domain-containing protein [Ammoniphilus sp. YIM 78166]
MTSFEIPIVVVSKCLGFDACRYNGEMLHDAVLEKLADYVRIITTCPEVEIGLGTPRDPIRIVEEGQQGLKLIQPATSKDVTGDMNRFSTDFLGSLSEVDGFILKSRSPSCALKDAKVFTGVEKAPVKGKGPGLFGFAVLEKYGHLAVEDEGRLKNYSIREHFLIKLFTLARFRQLKKASSHKALVEFQSQNKYLFMAYHQIQQKKLGKIIANLEQNSIKEVYRSYEQGLYELLERPATGQSNINVLFHILGYFKHSISAKEKAFFLSLIEKYRGMKVPLSSPLGVLKAWAVRFDNEYLMKQSYFEPYPEALVELLDSGKGRDLS